MTPLPPDVPPVEAACHEPISWSQSEVMKGAVVTLIVAVAGFPLGIAVALGKMDPGVAAAITTGLPPLITAGMAFYIIKGRLNGGQRPSIVKASPLA